MSHTRIPDVLAAVDLGSNSFHMVVGRYSHGQILIIDRLREMVRLGAGLDEHGRLSREATDTALCCLERFGQRLRELRAESVRVVGTNTLRRAKRRGAFLDRARIALGHPIEIISGMEEARLIYLGVTRTGPGEPGTRLVADIGGGSTELIIGEGLAPRRLESLHMGCVSMSNRFFADGEITEKRMKRARLAARQELEPIAAAFNQTRFDHAVGASGTIRAVHDILRARDPSQSNITDTAVESLIRECVRAGSVSRLKFSGLADERAPVMPGGLAVLIEILAMLNVRSMRVSDGALREGLLYDMLGRLTDEDARVSSLRAMQARYDVDTAQAERVEHTALALLSQVRAAWGLEDPFAETVLAWAARVHELGLDVSHSHYHKHGAYLLEHADMPGFPQEEQSLLACIVGSHRRKLHLETLEDLSPPWHVRAEFLIVLLRLAVLLHRDRSASDRPTPKLSAKARSLQLGFPPSWLESHPLTAVDLEQEVEYLRGAGFKLTVN